MKMKLALVSLALALFAASPAASQSNPRGEQQAACEDDAYRLCPDAIPDEARITNCLASQKANLSPACRAQFGAPKRRRPGKQ